MISDDECLIIGRTVVDAMRCRREVEYAGQMPLNVEYFDHKSEMRVMDWHGSPLFTVHGLRGVDAEALSVTFGEDSGNGR